MSKCSDINISRSVQNLISEALAIEVEEAKAAGKVGFMARALVQATMPHSKAIGSEFQRRNGAFRLTILAPSDIGLPYGSIPRLLMAWLSTEAVKTKQRDLILGNTLSEFMSELGLVPTGGRWGSITRLKDQLRKLFSSSISCTYDDGETWAIKNIQPIVQANLWWHPKDPYQSSLFESTLTLGEEFFNEVTTSPVPIHMGVLKALKRSPLALDIYCWLTYRMSYLRHATTIPWGALQIQFGSDYALTPQGTRNFKKAFVRELKKVLLFYQGINLEEKQDGLLLRPSKTHIPFTEKNSLFRL
jgi:hypothetical protein